MLDAEIAQRAEGAEGAEEEGGELEGAEESQMDLAEDEDGGVEREGPLTERGGNVERRIICSDRSIEMFSDWAKLARNLMTQSK